MNRTRKPAIKVDPTTVDERLADELAAEIEGKATGKPASATGWSDPFRASGMKHAI